MSIVIKMILVALAAVFPKFKKGYGMFLIILMSFISIHRVLEHPTFDGLTSDRRTIQLTA